MASRHCCVPGCVSDDRNDTTISFHTLPKNENLRKQWIIKMRRAEGPLFKVTAATFVCSKHFKKEDFKWTPFKKTLKSGSVPSVFYWTSGTEPRGNFKRKLLVQEQVIHPNTNREASERAEEKHLTEQAQEPITIEKESDMSNKELYELRSTDREELDMNNKELYEKKSKKLEELVHRLTNDSLV